MRPSLKRLFLGMSLASAGVVLAGIVMVYLHNMRGLIPIRANESLTAVSGLRTESNVLGWTTGWTDYSAYFRFHESAEWALNSAKERKLEFLGEMTQERCLGVPEERNPWWFNIHGNPRGDCWKLEQPSFRHSLFHDSASETALLRSFSW